MRSTLGLSAPPTALPEERTYVRYLANVRWVVLAAAIALAVVGLATVHSASSELEVDYLPRQAVRILIGLVAFVIVFSIDYQLLTKFALPIYLVALGLLVLVLLVGSEGRGRAELAQDRHQPVSTL